MMATPQAVKTIVDAAGGRLVGKTRLQKSAYLLEAAGVGLGFDFSYHYYGPYSDELAIAAEDAEALTLVTVKWETTQSGLQYAVYESSPSNEEDFSDISKRRKSILDTLAQYDSISLELAATAHFLRQNGYSDPWSETHRRKPEKASDDRVTKAKRLSAALGI
jgi:uncharacterized protein YwgA